MSIWERYKETDNHFKWKQDHTVVLVKALFLSECITQLQYQHIFMCNITSDDEIIFCYMKLQLT